jgi:hypothetical protein
VHERVHCARVLVEASVNLNVYAYVSLFVNLCKYMSMYLWEKYTIVVYVCMDLVS